MEVMKRTLDRLPPTVENGMDNLLREKLFDHLVDQEEYRAAANVLAGTHMEDSDEMDHGHADDDDRPYAKTAAERADVYVKIAKCFLSERDYVEADAFVAKAGAAVEAIPTSDSNFCSTSIQNQAANYYPCMPAFDFKSLSTSNSFLFEP